MRSKVSIGIHLCATEAGFQTFIMELRATGRKKVNVEQFSITFDEWTRGVAEFDGQIQRDDIRQYGYDKRQHILPESSVGSTSHCASTPINNGAITHFSIAVRNHLHTTYSGGRRFIARRGRPRIIYCDNGTNFRSAFNDLAKLDWHKISRETSTQKIVWKFIPPTAAWWGGWWERLVRIIKELLRRSLGKSILSYEELSTVICECEFLINSRPLTYNLKIHRN
ncbi:integrase catalytic domain-containing protein [Trichonephila clavipes]|nr:integrase catalytic domain-containing protein [Trichonephila clavipes]